MTDIKTLKEAEEEVVDSFSMYDEWLRVWLNYEVKDGHLYFTADSDAIITKGIISLLISVYSGRTPEEISSSDFSFIEKIGLKENLSPTRANGLASMIATIKTVALENLKK